jgi:hypothetical protein
MLTNTALVRRIFRCKMSINSLSDLQLNFIKFVFFPWLQKCLKNIETKLKTNKIKIHVQKVKRKRNLNYFWYFLKWNFISYLCCIEYIYTTLSCRKILLFFYFTTLLCKLEYCHWSVLIAVLHLQLISFMPICICNKFF